MHSIVLLQSRSSYNYTQTLSYYNMFYREHSPLLLAFLTLVPHICEHVVVGPLVVDPNAVLDPDTASEAQRGGL